MHAIDDAVGGFFVTARTPMRTTFFTAVTYGGNAEVVVGLFVIITLRFLYTKKYHSLGTFVRCLLVTGIIVYVAKLLFHRPRPLHALILETDYSFPSGHAAIAVALYGFIGYLLYKKYKHPTARFFIMLATLLIILLIASSRLYLGVHYFSDIIAGIIVGTSSLLFFIRLQNKKS